MTSRSSFDSKIGLTICSPHCIARLDAAREPLVSNCVAIGSRYMLSLRPAWTASDAQVVGCGSATTSSSSALRPFSDSGMRVMVLLPWPCTNMAFTLSFCATWSFGRASRRTSASAGCRASP